MKIFDWLFRRRRLRAEEERLAFFQKRLKEIGRKMEQQMSKLAAHSIQQGIELEIFGQPTSTDVNAPCVASAKPEDILDGIRAYKYLFGQVNQPDLPGIETELDKWIREIEFTALAQGFNLRERGRAILPESLKPEGWHDCLCPNIGFAPDEVAGSNVYFFTAPEFDLSQWSGIPFPPTPQPKQGIVGTA